MIQVICCSSLLSAPGRAGLLAGILPDRKTDKYFISRSGQTIDIEQNLQIQLQIETWHTIDKYGEYVQ